MAARAAPSRVLILSFDCTRVVKVEPYTETSTHLFPRPVRPGTACSSGDLAFSRCVFHVSLDGTNQHVWLQVGRVVVRVTARMRGGSVPVLPTRCSCAQSTPAPGESAPSIFWTDACRTGHSDPPHRIGSGAHFPHRPPTPCQANSPEEAEAWQKVTNRMTDCLVGRLIERLTGTRP